MDNYYRITAYSEEYDLSVIFDCNGRFEKLWEFSSFIVSHGFKVIFLTKSENIMRSTFPVIEQSQRIAVRAISKGRPRIDEFEYEGRRCKVISVSEKIYGQYV